MLNPATLANFTGTQSYTSFNGGLKLTEGARYLADNGGRGENGSAWWLMDIVFSYLFVAKVKREPFQVYKLAKNKAGSGAKLTVEDGNGNVVFTQRIPFSDFDFDHAGAEFVFWCVDKVILLPSEY